MHSALLHCLMFNWFLYKEYCGICGTNSGIINMDFGAAREIEQEIKKNLGGLSRLFGR